MEESRLFTVQLNQHYIQSLPFFPCLDVFKQRHGEKVCSVFHPAPLLSVSIISGSPGWGVEEAVTEEAPCKEEAPEVGVAGSQWGTEVPSRGLRCRGAGLCSGAACTREGWRRTGEEWTAGAGAWKLARGANRRSGCPLMDAAGTRGAECRPAWTGGCRWGSEEPGRTWCG